MGDTYVEWMVKKKPSTGMNVLKGILIALTVIMVLLGMVIVIFWIPAIIFGLAAYFLNLQGNLEYEYLYVDKELAVDKIMAKTKRKKLERFSIERMEILAPIKSWHLDDFKNRQLKTIDYGSGVEKQPDIRYVMIYNGEKRVIFEPNTEMVKAIQSVAPRKVFLD